MKSEALNFQRWSGGTVKTTQKKMSSKLIEEIKTKTQENPQMCVVYPPPVGFCYRPK